MARLARSATMLTALFALLMLVSCGQAAPRSVTVVAHTIAAATLTPATRPVSTLPPPAAASTASPVPSTLTVARAPTFFSGERAFAHVLTQMAIGPRAAGSQAAQQTANFISGQLKALGWEVESQEFTYRDTLIRNVVGRRGSGSGAPIILGAHYDTRPVAEIDPTHPEQPVPGADDGASGVAVLLELARAVEVERMDGPLWLAFFDAEDRGRLDGWEWSVGARHFAQGLTVRPRAVVVVDMVGDADQQIYKEKNSDPGLTDEIWAVAKAQGIDSFKQEYNWSMTDDHTPFLELGLPAALLIDFDYPAWHTTSDTTDKVSGASLEAVGRVLEVWLEQQK
jgi:glutaminyl-peptide cyclotransferase